MANNEKLNIEILIKIDQANKKLELIDKKLKNISQSSKDTANGMNNITSSIFKGNVAANLFTDALNLTQEALTRAVKVGFDYAVQMEKLQLAMTSVIYATSELRNAEGQLLSVQEKNAVAYSLAIAQRQRLVDINRETVTTLQNTIRVFNTMAPSLRKSGASYEQIEVLTKSIANSSIAFTGTFEQMLAIIDGIGDGTYRANSEYGRFLNNLGVSTTKIKEIKDAGGDVAGYLIKQFEAIEANNERLQKTYIQNFNEFKSLSEQGLGSLAEGLKDTLSSIFESINEELKTINFETLSKESEIFFKKLSLTTKIFSNNIEGLKNGINEIFNTSYNNISEIPMIKVIDFLTDGLSLSYYTLKQFGEEIGATLALISGNLSFDDYKRQISLIGQENSRLLQETINKEDILTKTIRETNKAVSEDKSIQRLRDYIELQNYKDTVLTKERKELENNIKATEEYGDKSIDTFNALKEMRERLTQIKAEENIINNYEQILELNDQIINNDKEMIELKKQLNDQSLSDIELNVIKQKITQNKTLDDQLLYRINLLSDYNQYSINGIKDEEEALKKLTLIQEKYNNSKLDGLKQSIELLKNESKYKNDDLNKDLNSLQINLDYKLKSLSENYSKEFDLLKGSKEEQEALTKYYEENFLLIFEKYSLEKKSILEENTEKEKEEWDKREENAKDYYNKLKDLDNKLAEERLKNSSGGSTLSSDLQSIDNTRDGLKDKYTTNENGFSIFNKEAFDKENELLDIQVQRIKDKYAKEIKDTIFDLQGSLTMSWDEQQNYEMESLDRQLEEKAQKLRDAGMEEVEITKMIEEQKENLRRQQHLATVDMYAQQFGSLASGMDAMMNTFSIKSKGFFRAQQAAAIASATMSMYTGIAKALELGWPMSIPAAAAAMTNGIAAIGQIRAQTPKFHDGGYITQTNGTNEVPATLQTGEGVLSRRGMKALDELNRGGANGGGNVEIIMVNNMEEAIAKQMQSRSGRAIIKQIAG